jgi:hypothetical protein
MRREKLEAKRADKLYEKMSSRNKQKGKQQREKAAFTSALCTPPLCMPAQQQ